MTDPFKHQPIYLNKAQQDAAEKKDKEERKKTAALDEAMRLIREMKESFGNDVWMLAVNLSPKKEKYLTHEHPAITTDHVAKAAAILLRRKEINPKEIGFSSSIHQRCKDLGH